MNQYGKRDLGLLPSSQPHVKKARTSSVEREPSEEDTMVATADRESLTLARTQEWTSFISNSKNRKDWRDEDPDEDESEVSDIMQVQVDDQEQAQTEGTGSEADTFAMGLLEGRCLQCQAKGVPCCELVGREGNSPKAVVIAFRICRKCLAHLPGPTLSVSNIEKLFLLEEQELLHAERNLKSKKTEVDCGFPVDTIVKALVARYGKKDTVQSFLLCKHEKLLDKVLEEARVALQADDSLPVWLKLLRAT